MANITFISLYNILMETLQQYLQRLDDCIERNRYSDSYDLQTVEFLLDLKRLQSPKEYHSCDDPYCIVCGCDIE